jgi:CDP-diacylglycerol--serine O-phosphatidyltransferase
MFERFLKLLPHFLTMLACCAGLTAVLHAVDGDYQGAVMFLLAAALLDMLDGRAARKLGVDSQFGVELDSLADVISFGVAPGLILYHWLFYDLEGQFGLAVVVVMGVCAALRLARFNAMKIAGTDETQDQDTTEEPEQKSRSQDAFFTGLAAPSAAVLALLPMVISFGIWPALTAQSWIEPAVAGWVLVIGLLMVSNVPTFSFKGGNKTGKVRLQLLAAAVVLLAFAIEPWITLAIMSTIYICTIPLAYWQQRN